MTAGHTIGTLVGFALSLALGLALSTVPVTVPPAAAQESRADAASVDRVLFAALAAAPTPDRAAVVAEELRRRWRASDSDTVALLFEQADALRTDGALVPARAKLTGIVQLRPQLVQGWADRGAVHWALGEHDAAMNDLEAALELEPRHFEALVLRAEILEAEGNFLGALRAYRQAQAVHPHMPGVADRVRRLTRIVETDGRTRL